MKATESSAAFVETSEPLEEQSNDCLYQSIVSSTRYTSLSSVALYATNVWRKRKVFC